MTQEKTKKNLFSFLLRFGLSAFLLWIIFRQINIPQTIEAIKSADLKSLTIALGLFLATISITIWRWFIFIQALKLNVSRKEAIRYYLIGLFGNLFLPTAIGGDLLKTIGLCRGNNEKPKVVASILLDRLSGFASMSIIAVVGFLYGYKIINDMVLLVPVALLALGSVTVAAFLFNEHIYAWGCKIFNRLPKFKAALMQMHYDIILLKSEKLKGFKALAISCLAQLIFAICYFMIARALHQEVNIVYFLIFVPLINVISIVPSIGGLGVREFGAVALFGRIGVVDGVAASITLIIFFFMVIVGLLGGAVYGLTLSSGRLQHNSPDDGDSSQA